MHPCVGRRQALRFSTYPKRKDFTKANTTFTAGERAKDPRKFMVNQLSRDHPSPSPSQPIPSPSQPLCGKL